jgi:hypothetical protein
MVQDGFLIFSRFFSDEKHFSSTHALPSPKKMLKSMERLVARPVVLAAQVPVCVLPGERYLQEGSLLIKPKPHEDLWAIDGASSTAQTDSEGEESTSTLAEPQAQEMRAAALPGDEAAAIAALTNLCSANVVDTPAQEDDSLCRSGGCDNQDRDDDDEGILQSPPPGVFLSHADAPAGQGGRVACGHFHRRQVFVPGARYVGFEHDEHAGEQLEEDDDDMPYDMDLLAEAGRAAEARAAALVRGGAGDVPHSPPRATGTPPVIFERIDGLLLHTSERSATGYKGVYQKNRQSFEAVVQPNKPRKEYIVLGTYKTAVEAALCYARFALLSDAAKREQITAINDLKIDRGVSAVLSRLVDEVVATCEGPRPPKGSGGGGASERGRGGGGGALSSRKRASPAPDKGRGVANQRKAKRGRREAAGRNEDGSRSTPRRKPQAEAQLEEEAEEADEQEWVQCEQCDKWRRICLAGGKALPEVWVCSLADPPFACTDPEEMYDDEDSLVTHSEGLELHLDENCITGYKGVRKVGNGPTPYAVTARSEGSVGKMINLGHFQTAVEGALCYARHILLFRIDG